MLRCDCCQEECLFVVPVKNVNSTVTYDLLCDVCATFVDQARDDELYLTLVEQSLADVPLAA